MLLSFIDDPSLALDFRTYCEISTALILHIGTSLFVIILMMTLIKILIKRKHVIQSGAMEFERYGHLQGR